MKIVLRIPTLENFRIPFTKRQWLFYRIIRHDKDLISFNDFFVMVTVWHSELENNLFKGKVPDK